MGFFSSTAQAFSKCSTQSLKCLPTVYPAAEAKPSFVLKPCLLTPATSDAGLWKRSVFRQTEAHSRCFHTVPEQTRTARLFDMTQTTKHLSSNCLRVVDWFNNVLIFIYLVLILISWSYIMKIFLCLKMWLRHETGVTLWLKDKKKKKWIWIIVKTQRLLTHNNCFMPN